MLEIFKTNLSLFEGGDGGGSAGEGSTSAAAGQDTGDLSKVVYGKQDASAAPAEETAEDINSDAADHIPTTEERTKAYKDLINGEYKDIHTSEMQKIFDRRFKDHKELEKKVTDQSAVIERLSEKYKITDGNIDSLIAAIDGDDALWESEAYEAGMTVDQYKEFQKLNRENQKLIKAESDRQAAAQAEARVQQWTAEAEQLSQQIPGFELNTELENPDFVRLIQSGVPMEHAFKVAHFDEITGALANATEKKVIDNVRAKGSRPVENGTTSQSSFTLKNDVTKLTKKDRAEIARRVTRGEKISF